MKYPDIVYSKILKDVKRYMTEDRLKNKIRYVDDNGVETETIFEIAKVFESKLVLSGLELPLTGFYPNNPFFSPPYLPVKNSSGNSLQQAMEIYDSLRVTNKNAQAAYRLAEVQFRVLGDLDGALYLYQEALIHGNSKSLQIDAGLGLINILIAKGDLESAEKNSLEKYKKADQIAQYIKRVTNADKS